MTIEVETQTDMETPDGVVFPFDYEKTAHDVVCAVLNSERFPYEAEVHIFLVDDAAIHELNYSERGVDQPTDVLSFPMIEYPAAGDFHDMEQQPFNFHPETGEAVLGDIVVSVDKVCAQALEYGHGRKREFAFLITHSMLHLLGYDHMEPDEAEDMEGRQEAVLNGLGIVR